MLRPARRFLAAITLAAALGAVAVLTPAGSADAVALEAPVAVAPAEGAFLEPGSVVLEWSAVEAPLGYEVTWSATDGAEADAGTVTTESTSAAIDIEGGSYVWQVRVLPDGAWSAPATFHADLELPTLALPDQPTQPEAAPVAARGGMDAIPGGVWIGGALAFSAVLLGAVAIQSRSRREQDA